MRRIILKIFLIIILVALPQVGITNSYFSDETTISGITVTTGDWTAPYVKIEAPSHGDTLSGSAQIYGTVTDNAPHHYWLVVQTLGGSTIAGPNTVNNFVSFTNQFLFTWDTTGVADGSYLIKLEARDAAGNKEPNLAPVLVDPEDPNDSVDWITVTVNNAPPAPPTATTGPVVINEVYYDAGGSHGSEPDNEWVELYNNADYDINLLNWTLVDSEGVTGTVPSEVIIPAHGFAVLSNEDTTWGWWSILPGVPTINLAGPDLQLGNSGDWLRLYDSGALEKDFVAWEGEFSGWNLSANDDQSIARIVKGVDTNSPLDWQVLASPNPGTNPHSGILETNLDFYFAADKLTVGFKVSGGGVAAFDKAEFKVTYDSDAGPQAIVGSVDILGASEIQKDDLILGSSSSGGTRTYHTGVTAVNIEVILKGAVERTLTATLVK